MRTVLTSARSAKMPQLVIYLNHQSNAGASVEHWGFSLQIFGASVMVSSLSRAREGATRVARGLQKVIEKNSRRTNDVQNEFHLLKPCEKFR